MTAIIGISALYHDAAAAGVRDGEIVAAAQEERFTRRRHDARFPVAALDYCAMRMGGLANVDALAFYEDPVLAFDRVLCNVIDLAPQNEYRWPAIARSQLTEKLTALQQLAEIRGTDGKQAIFVVEHHLSHLASAFYPSPFRDAAVVVVDGVGEWASTTIADGTDLQLAPITQITYPHSLGLFYSAFTYHCGFKVNSGEYKLMGLAPFGTPRYTRLLLDNLIDLREDGSFRLNTEYFGYLTTERATSEAFERLVGCPRREPEGILTERHIDLAASAQSVLEKAMQGIASRALALTGRKRLCLAGGVALNCVANGKLLRNVRGLEDLWVQPAAGDAGGALGAALHVAHTHYGANRHALVEVSDGQKGSLLGPEYPESEIEDALRDAGLSWQRAEDAENLADRVAHALADGLIVARFYGRMEFGPRALGNRSIIADARRSDGQSYINMRIKHRESWRPFAPAVLLEHVGAYFDLTTESPYMLLTVSVRKDICRPEVPSEPSPKEEDLLRRARQQRSTIPAVTHVDYSARVQTVDSRRNPDFHRLLQHFHALTGCPLLVNTSFNVRGEPIVCGPHDAVRCFVNSGIDLLAIGNCLVFKHEQSARVRSLEGQVQHELD